MRVGAEGGRTFGIELIPLRLETSQVLVLVGEGDGQLVLLGQKVALDPLTSHFPFAPVFFL